MNVRAPGRKIGLFPASFDPLTNGHLDLVQRGLRVFDEVVVALARNVAKSGTFSTEERVQMLNDVLGEVDRVSVRVFDGLVVEYAREIGACAIIRGLRAMSDFEYEFEMALMNRHLEPEVEIIFLAASQDYLYVSSSRLKELIRFGASVADFVPPAVEERLKQKLAGDL
ncbi:MAG: pantetheine-phosphate adenylyltransferase [bacterium TMED88]|nr:pantetheine-phosphate adenylyltransferase [Deltaproteobacteria bacterium]OUV32706.1 MAG: pantetheine-phosphate adenylyltransferase [bacterium TMED88]